MNGTVRSKRGAASPAFTESEFHQMRTQEHVRASALTTLGATEQQVASSYFTASLQEMSAQRLADGFGDSCDADALREEQPELYAMVLERLPTDPATMLPLRITVPRIMDERYWQRCCEARWPLGQLSRMVGGEKLLGKEYGWKRLFLERVLCDYLMALGSTNTDADGGLLPATAVAGSGGHRSSVSSALNSAAAAANACAVSCTAHDADANRFDLGMDDSAVAALRELCAICRDYVHTVELPCQLVHFRFHEHLFAHVPGILSFRLTYGVAKRGVRVGVTDMIGFRDDDAAEMRQLLRHYSALESLRLPLNRLQDRHVQMVAAGLANSTTLRVLDVSQNALTDVAVVDGVAVLLSRPDFPLEELYLQDNRLGSGAAAALAEALHLNKTLRILHIQQNCIGDADGGALLVRALAVQPTLVDVDLSNNQLGASTRGALVEVLPKLSRLSVLRVAGNLLLAGSTVPTGAAAAPSAIVEEGTAVKGAAPSVSAASLHDSPPSAEAGSTTSLPTTSSIAPSMTSKASVAGADTDAAMASVTIAATPDTSRTAGPKSQSTTVAASTAETVQGAGGSTTEAAVVATERTEGGAVLCDAVSANASLVELDVRLCGFTAAEETAMMCGVQQRVFQRKMETTVATKEAERRRELRQRAEERVARMTGRVA